ncbi:MAG: hypothetical protein ACQJCO_06650 [cyanobacterium endosymbiont of Rhopalodia sterrenbergii]
MNASIKSYFSQIHPSQFILIRSSTDITLPSQSVLNLDEESSTVRMDDQLDKILIWKRRSEGVVDHSRLNNSLVQGNTIE